MPYISQLARSEIKEGWAVTSSGELNYQITNMVKAYMETKGLNYQTINDILGALDGASKEFYRRVAAPYEDLAIERNGDVY